MAELKMPTCADSRSRLLGLPAELREQIWLHVVTDWAPLPSYQRWDLRPWHRMLQQASIRIDRFNQPLPPAITRVNKQLRAETLPLYYQCNIFEFWRPKGTTEAWQFSTFISWLDALGPEAMKLLKSIVLMYKHPGELDDDIDEALKDMGYHLNPGIISCRRELSEYEMCYEQLGLPRRFGRHA